jgi:hypothetical protein
MAMGVLTKAVLFGGTAAGAAFILGSSAPVPSAGPNDQLATPAPPAPASPLVVTGLATFSSEETLIGYARHLCSVVPLKPDGTRDFGRASTLANQCAGMFSNLQADADVPVMLEEAVTATAPAATESASPPPPPPPPPPEAAPPPPLMERQVDVRVEITPPAENAAAADGESITNTQVRGVDEGGIVKKVGPFILTLMDGRIFSVDTRAGGLRLADRQNVYRLARDATWYDEMLIDGDRAIVTAYSYERQATELSVFRIDLESGAITPEGVFYLPSYDYYSSDNYATRIASGRLIVTTTYPLSMMLDEKRAPQIRRSTVEARPLLAANDIYWPVLATDTPVVHAVINCKLDESGTGQDLNCDSKGFVGPANSEMYVTPDDVYLAVWGGSRDDYWWYEPQPRQLPRCNAEAIAPSAVSETAVYKVPVTGAEVRVVKARGAPFNQMSMDVQGGHFHMLADWTPSAGCDQAGRGPPVSLVNVPLAAFEEVAKPLPDAAYKTLPQPLAWSVVNRFTTGWLVYGSDEDPYSTDSMARRRASSQTWAVSLPGGQASEVPIGHSVVRIEPVGRGMIVNGYSGSSSLRMAYVGLETGSPVVKDHLTMAGRAESEGRSHAFNSLTDASGGALIGLPTVPNNSGGDARTPWRSEQSDLSYITLSPQGKLTRAGELGTSQFEPHQGYTCEVSCIDWYGNARALFFNRRILALMGTQIVEGKLIDGTVRPTNRLDLTRPAQRNRR